MTPTTEAAALASHTIAGDGHRYAAFQQHLATCPTCSAEHGDMCNQGYWLLIGALGIVANSPILSA